MTLPKMIFKTISKEAIAQAKVLVVGDAMLDRYWYGSVDRISPEAPVPVVRVTREEERIGAAANVAYNVVTMGAQASLLTVVGEDDASHKLEALVATTGITPYFGRNADLKTTVKLRIIGRQQQLLRVDFENKPKTDVLASQTSTFAKHITTHDVVLFSDYAKGGLAHVVDMIALARATGKTVLVDPKGRDALRHLLVLRLGRRGGGQAQRQRSGHGQGEDGEGALQQHGKPF